MPADGITKPYLDAWLKRTAKALAGSGKLSELSLILARDGEMDAAAWRSRMQRILERVEEPSFELLTKVDSVLARPAKPVGDGAETRDLFS
ncbi:MAG: hypothetical protein IZT59_03465 [Verrucomicrobia bacterium]|jgi:hypothetical protein|nr:hypothetical protein [Verrucomicrobiota bacterium]|tara:strand:- start:20104 stop:20376 length:273 start_codon:yes stop_codon:yes gene_type:complete